MALEVKSSTLIRYILIEILLFLVLIVLAVQFDAVTLFLPISQTFASYIPSVLAIFGMLIATKLLLKLIGPPFQHGLSRIVRSEADTQMIWQLVRYLIWMLMIISVVVVFILEDEASNTLLGASVVLAAAMYILQRPILNIAGWLAIIFRRPYKISDRIEIDGIRGYVIEISILHTLVRELEGWMGPNTYSGRIIAIPNSAIFEGPIFNYTRDHRFIFDEVKVSITYESDHDEARKILQTSAEEVAGEIMEKHALTLIKSMEIRELQQEVPQKPYVRMEFAPSSLDISVIYFTFSDRRRDTSSSITEKVMAKIKSSSRVDVAYPHMHLVK